MPPPPRRSRRHLKRLSAAPTDGRPLQKLLHSLLPLLTITYCCYLIASPAGQSLVAALAAGEQQLQPESMALVSGNNNNNKQQESTAVPTAAAASAAAPNVILIKYANVTNKQQTTTGEPAADDEQQQQQLQEQLHLFKLYEPLSVSIIESKFSNSIQLFDVSHNQLSTLPNNLFCPLSNEVRQLNISHNLLENFDCLGLISQAGQLCLSDLRVLDMSHNLIKHLPATGVATLQNLEILNLSNNLIESLDELSLATLYKLTRLDLSHNHIQQLPIRIFHKSTSMQVLRLQSNLIQTSISHSFLSGLVALEELDLSRNRISQVNDSAFIDKVNLTRVDLSHNQLSSLHQAALNVTSVRQATGGYRQRLLHNGQFAGIIPKQTHSQSFSAEIYLAHNPFVCDCHLEWMRKLQPTSSSSSAIKRTVLSPAPSSTSSNTASRVFSATTNSQMEPMLSDQPYQHHHQYHRQHPSHHQHPTADLLSAQLMQLSSSYQSDQPSSPVIYAASSSSSSSASSDGNNNNVSEIQASPQGEQRPPMAGSQILQAGAIANQLQAAPSYHFARIADLDLIKCAPLFKRNSLARNNNNNHHHQHHYRPTANGGGGSSGQSRALATPDGAHHNHHLVRQQQQQQQQEAAMIDLVSADSSNFLCRYKNHCFALCHCCEFDACDCEMICPAGCNCYYDSLWQTNIIDCSSNNHTVVPDRIPMDVSVLHLDGNNIESVKPSNLIARRSLKTLYLNGSNLQYIANRTFNGLVELTSLYLHDNMLRSLHGYEFEPLAQLRALYLQSNRLDHISNQTFIYLRSLEVLDLSNNRLTAQNLDLFLSIGHHNVRLRQLSIAYNWWSCQCSAINRFRQILKQKFLLTGSVNIVDKNQLRCYYNATTVGPLILAGPESAASSLSSPLYGYNWRQQQQQKLQQQQQQQTQLTEINQCSETIDLNNSADTDLNPPVFFPPEPPTSYPMVPPALSEYPNDPTPIQSLPQPLDPNQQAPTYPQLEAPVFVPSPPMMQPGQPASRAPGSMPLTSFLLLCILMAGIMVIAVSIFLFVRRQQRYHQHRHHHHQHHKKSSAASTASVSSTASSTAISSLNGGGKGRQHPHHHQHHLVGTQLPHHHHHHLIMSNGNGGAAGTLASGINHHLQQQQQQQQPQQHPLSNHHHHSASSQSNIYAALVSPSHGQSTTVSTAAAANQQAPTIINNHQQAANNLYSNSSTTASQSSNGGVNGYFQQQHQQQQQYLHHGPYSVAMPIDHYGAANGSSQASYKTPSLYNAPNCHSAAELDGHHHQPAAGDLNWAHKLPKVKQFMSKLVNKSLALGGLRAGQSRDELGSITSDKIYDAFISYDKRDEAFVMQHLSAELEYGQPQYRIADRYRDLPQPSSAYMAEAITSVIGCSHRTIIVLTEHYLASDWCRYELQAALHESGMDKSHKIIAVVLDPKCLLDMDADMRALLTNQGATIYHKPSLAASQLVQLDNGDQQQQQQQQLLATLTGSQLVGGQQQLAGGNEAQVAQLATSRINFINYNERKFWPKIKQLMPLPRPSTQTLTLTTKN